MAFWRALQVFGVIRILVLGYAVITLIFAGLLTLPIASSERVSQPFIDALFVATSGISTTGLTVVDVGSFYSLFGQIVLLVNFQVGGIGYMAFYILLAYVITGRLSLTAQLVGKESVTGAGLRDFTSFFVLLLIFTFSIEFIGAAILSVYWAHEFPLPRAIYLGIFHSVSAFCTAGFALFPDSLMSYQDSVTVNLVVDILSILGGIGFYVFYDIYNLSKKAIKRERPNRLSEHSKLAMLVTIILLFIGTGVILISEEWPPSTIIGNRLLISSFQAISASTTDGFNTVVIGEMSHTSLFMIIILTLIGASPGGTAGGIKTTTLGIMFATILSLLRGQSEVNVFKKRIPDATIERSFMIFLLFVLILTIDMLVLATTEKASFLPVLFEISSALGNTGLSTGITPNLSIVGKIFLIFTMFIGRVGPATIAFAVFGKTKPMPFKYPKGEVFVG